MGSVDVSDVGVCRPQWVLSKSVMWQFAVGAIKGDIAVVVGAVSSDVAVCSGCH